jgi:glycosyltransferase 2 family protein
LSRASGLHRALRLTVAALLVTAFGAWTMLHVDLPALSVILAGADPTVVLLAMPALILAIWTARTVRWLVVLAALGIAAPFGRTYLSIGAALGLAVVTPFQAGELLKLAHARRAHRVELATAAGGFAAERALDILVLAALTLAAGLTTGTGRLFWALCALAGAGAVLAMVLRMHRYELPVSLARGLQAALDLRPWRILLPMVAATVASWLLTALLWQTAAAAVDVHVPFSLNILLVGFVMLATIASLVPGGAGVSDFAAVAVLVQHGYAAEQAVAAAMMLRLITVLAAVLGVLHWMVLRAVLRHAG